MQQAKSSNLMRYWSFRGLAWICQRYLYCSILTNFKNKLMGLTNTCSWNCSSHCKYEKPMQLWIGESISETSDPGKGVWPVIYSWRFNRFWHLYFVALRGWWTLWFFNYCIITILFWKLSWSWFNLNMFSNRSLMLCYDDY